MTIQQIKSQSQRRAILEILIDDTNYSVNDRLLQQIMASATHNHALSIDLLRTELVWLEEQGLITTQELPSTFVATLTTRGADVAEGLANAPGIAKKRPL